MSFLNALASDGLSVGLRFYTDKLNARSSCRAEEVSGWPEEAQTSPGASAQAEEVKRPQKTTPPPPPQTPEEQAAGRAEAQARLTADAAIGQLQAAKRAPEGGSQTEGQEDVQGAESSGAAMAAAAAAAGSSKGLTPEEEKEVARLKEREAQIKAEVQSSVNRGVDGADSVQYNYTTGPDENRYVSGIQGGQSGAGNPGAQAGAEQAAAGGLAGAGDLSEEEQKQVEEMKKRDREVRTHEQAHVAAAAGLAGAPVYEYQAGPDGKRYAVGGHVDVQTSGSSDPETALREAEAVKRAATAPAEPSSADRAAAASASADINRIKAEKASQKGDEPEKDLADQGELHSLKADNQVHGAAFFEMGREEISAPNGSTFNRQVLGAYAAAKFGAATMRPMLATA